MKLTVHRLNLNGSSSGHFDLIRGIAAVYVMIFHFRQQMFVGISMLSHPSLEIKFIYLLTSIGYQFVMAFFVLSGFLISTSVIQQVRNGRWSWRVYLTSRLVRLWVVLIPGLFLTFGWDKLASFLTGNSSFYHGTLNWGNFWGNVLFLQGIITPTYGQNIPLWSLSYEFWYYLLFPCIVLAIATRRPITRFIYGFLAVAIAVFIGKAILVYFSVWMLGLLVAVLPKVTIPKRWRRLTVIAAVGLTAGVMVGGKLLQYESGGSGNMLQSFPTSFATGVAFAGLFYVLLHFYNDVPKRKSSWNSPNLVSRMSYSLYLTHCPVILALRLVVGYETWMPNLYSLIVSICVCIGIICYATLVAYFTEFNTTTIRNLVLGILSRIFPARNGVSNRTNALETR